MSPYLCLWILFYISPIFCQASTFGSVELNEFSFNKIISKFEFALVKFDAAFPYGDKHDAYLAFSKEVQNVDDLLIAEVGVKDYGEKDNEELAKKYGATKDNFPVVKLFVKGEKEPFTFDDSKGFNTDELRRFVKQKTGIYLSLPGCIKELDKLASNFMTSKTEDRKNVLRQAEEVLKSLKKEDQTMGKVYVLYMKKILEVGNDFVNSENERIKKLLKDKMTEEKKKEFGYKLNILQSFLQKDDFTKEEL